ncbi:MAG: magnesium transporter CorA family protein [Hyphomicrobiaceae bacterium]
MITIYEARDGGLRRTGDDAANWAGPVWIDLSSPTPEEDARVEKLLGISIPTRAEAREIEASSRLYQENGAHYMTAFIVYNTDTLSPSTSTLTFILAPGRLITVRYCEPKAFPIFLSRIEKREVACNSAPAVMVGLVETLIHRMADLIERLQDEVERTAHAVFDIKGGQQTRGRRLDALLRAAGKEGDIVSRSQESCFSLDRLLAYLATILREQSADQALLKRVKSAQRDVNSLIDHLRFLSERITFLLDATLGMINIEQNAIIKIFSVASVALMPPTLIASIYGMNFKHMPELGWPYGYPLALCLMVLSAALPFIYFRKKGWF